MTTWSGWAADFLSAASLPDTATNRQFLNAWADNADHKRCVRNPIDLPLPEPHSTNCAPVTGGVWTHVQNYSSHTWARTAFNTMIHSGDFPALLAALRSGDPYSVNDRTPVGNNLRFWGSVKFANMYAPAPGGGPSGGGGSSASVHGGWHSIRQTLNHSWPATLNRSERNVRVALRSLGGRHRVRG